MLGVLILWIGWMGFNPGSFLGVVGAGTGTNPNYNYNFADVAINTNLAAAAGCIGSMLSCWLLTRSFDVNQMGNGAVGALVAITASCAFVDAWAAVVIGFVAGVIVPPGELMWEKVRARRRRRSLSRVLSLPRTPSCKPPLMPLSPVVPRLTPSPSPPPPPADAHR